MRPLRGHARGLWLLLCLALLSACVSLPDHGAVVESRVAPEAENRRAGDIDARPPVVGASRIDVVTGFLEAMTAWPIQTSVAKQYLTGDAASQWTPEQGTIVYSDTQPAREVGGAVTVRLASADGLDSIGAWRGALVEDQLRLEFRVTVEDGEFRIADPPDALIVPASWFQQRYRQVSLFYFDPIAQTLVPEPVFVREGEQLATSLVSALIAGPPPLVRSVVRSFVPPGLSVGLSVPVNDAGVATVTLLGDAPELKSESAEMMLAQFAWTLRQDPQIKAFRVTIGGRDVPLPGGAEQYPLEAADKFDPSGVGVSPDLFAVSSGRLFSGAPGSLAPVSGPLGDEGAGVDAVAVRPDGEQAAVLDGGGSRVRVGPVRSVTGDRPFLTVRSGGRYLRPTWDTSARFWFLERRAGGVVVWVVEDDDPTSARQIPVDGVTGTDARMLMVSRDGTRLIAVVRTAAGDAVRGVRVVIGGRGRVIRTTGSFGVHEPDGSRITDLAWTSPIRLALLTPTAPDLFEMDVVAADGATIGVDLSSTIVSGEVVGIAARPGVPSRTFAVYADRYVDIVGQREYDAPPDAPLAQLDYVG